MTDLIEEYKKVALDVFGEPQLAIESGKGSILRDYEGREYIDLLGGIAVNALGVANDELAQALYEQAKSLTHVSNFFTTEPQVKLAAKLLQLFSASASGAEWAGTDYNAPSDGGVFFTNSGTESIECALKIVKKHAHTLADAAGAGSAPPRIIALEGSFHGRTLGALSLTHKEKYRTPFAPLIPNIEFIPAGNLNALDAAFSTTPPASASAHSPPA
jgi:acetylornithine aminotransferase